MNKNSKLLLVIVTVFLLTSSIEVECRRTYSTSGRSSSGRGSRGRNQPSSGGLFSSWFGGSKSSSSGSGSISKPQTTSAKKNWQTASSSATSQSKPSAGWSNPYYKSPGSGVSASAPKEPAYGWKATNTKPASSLPSANVGSRGYPVQSGVQQGSQSLGGYKPAATGSAGYHAPGQTGYHAPGQTSYHAPGQSSYHAPGQTNYHGTGQTGYHAPGYQAPSYHQPSYGAPHAPSYAPSGGHYPQQPSYHSPGYSPQSSFGGAVPTYQGTKLFGSSSGHYGYPGSGSWGIDTYGAKKSSSGTGKLLTGLAVGAAGGYLTSSLVNRISNPWRYSGYGYGGGYGGYGGLGYGGYDLVRSRDESAFERGFERGLQAKEKDSNNNNNKQTQEPEDPTAKWIQCVAFDPQTQQTLINPNCSCTVTTSVDERTGEPLSVHHCTTLNGLVMRPVPVQPNQGVQPVNSPAPGVQPLGSSQSVQPLENSQPSGVLHQTFVNGQPAFNPEGQTLGNGQPVSNLPGQGGPAYEDIYLQNFQYNGGATVYIPPRNAPEPIQPVTEERARTTESEMSATETKSEASTTETKLESSTGTVPKQLVGGGERVKAEGLAGGVEGMRKSTAEFYGQLQKIVNMGNFVDGG